VKACLASLDTFGDIKLLQTDLVKNKVLHSVTKCVGGKPHENSMKESIKFGFSFHRYFSFLRK
jgi:hypothetical protein